MACLRASRFRTALARWFVFSPVCVQPGLCSARFVFGPVCVQPGPGLPDGAHVRHPTPARRRAAGALAVGRAGMGAGQARVETAFIRQRESGRVDAGRFGPPRGAAGCHVHTVPAANAKRLYLRPQPSGLSARQTTAGLRRPPARPAGAGPDGELGLLPCMRHQGRVPQARRLPTFVNAISVVHRLSDAVPVSRLPAIFPRSTVKLWNPCGLLHSPEARRVPSAPTVPVIFVSGLKSCILRLPPATSAAVLPVAAVIPHASRRFDSRVPTYRPSYSVDGSGLETPEQPHSAGMASAKRQDKRAGARERFHEGSVCKPGRPSFRTHEHARPQAYDRSRSGPT